MTGPGHCRKGFLQSVLPHLVSATGERGTLACPRVFPSELAGGPGRAERSSGPWAGSFEPVHSAQGGLARHWGRETLSPSVSLALLSQILGVEGEEDLDGVQILHFLLKFLLLKFPGKMLEATERRPTGRGVDGRVEGSGKHHWPSESGIETDGRGEQYYHSKDPMGAIQQIPY